MAKRCCLTIEQKFLIIKEIEKGMKKKNQIAKEHGIAATTVSTILKNRQQIITEVSTSVECHTRKKIRICDYPDIEEAILKWITVAQAENLPIRGTIVRQKAKDLAITLGHNSFLASAGWLEKFKKRHNMTQMIGRRSFKAEPGDYKIFAHKIEDQSQSINQTQVQVQTPIKMEYCDEYMVENIMRNHKHMQDFEVEDSETDVAVRQLPTFAQVDSALETLKNFVASRYNVSGKVFTCLHIIEDFIEREKHNEMTNK